MSPRYVCVVHGWVDRAEREIHKRIRSLHQKSIQRLLTPSPHAVTQMWTNTEVEGGKHDSNLKEDIRGFNITINLRNEMVSELGKIWPSLFTTYWFNMFGAVLAHWGRFPGGADTAIATMAKPQATATWQGEVVTFPGQRSPQLHIHRLDIYLRILLLPYIYIYICLRFFFVVDQLQLTFGCVILKDPKWHINLSTLRQNKPWSAAAVVGELGADGPLSVPWLKNVGSGYSKRNAEMMWNDVRWCQKALSIQELQPTCLLPASGWIWVA